MTKSKRLYDKLKPFLRVIFTNGRGSHLKCRWNPYYAITWNPKVGRELTFEEFILQYLY